MGDDPRKDVDDDRDGDEVHRQDGDEEAPVAERLPDLRERHPEEGRVEQQPEHGVDRQLRRVRNRRDQQPDARAEDERGEVEGHLPPLHPLDRRPHESYPSSLPIGH